MPCTEATSAIFSTLSIVLPRINNLTFLMLDDTLPLCHNSYLTITYTAISPYHCMQTKSIRVLEILHYHTNSYIQSPIRLIKIFQQDLYDEGRLESLDPGNKSLSCVILNINLTNYTGQFPQIKCNIGN